MNLDDFYNANEVPDEDRLKLPKNIVLTVPDKDYDVEPVLERLGLSRYEVAAMWPKPSVDFLSEICAARPKLVLQAGRRFFRKYPYVGNGEYADRYALRVREAVADGFVNLHHHDEFSLRDGLGTVEQLVDLLKAQRRSFCAVTNHGSVGGWIKQYNACRKSGVKPIFGMEAYTSNYRGDDPEEKKKHRSANHLVVLAGTEEGFHNIIRIHNDAQMHGFYYTPRADREAFRKWGKGVVGTSACLAGELPLALMEDDRAKAIEAYEFYSNVFNEFYIELQIIEYEMQREANRRLIKFAEDVGAPVIIAVDSHYLYPEHADTHDLLMMMRQGKTILDKREKEEDVWNFDVRNLFYRDEGRLQEVFENGYHDMDGNFQQPFRDEVFTDEVFSRAVASTRSIAMRADDIELDSEIKLPKLYDDSIGMLRDKINSGFRGLNLNKKSNKKEYYERIRYEFDVITRLGWADYFLIMERIISGAIEKFGDWAVGYGRGSAAGSLISYCLGITFIDPIEHGLLFERFLDETRSDPPDIDTDFQQRIREEVKRGVVDDFGEDNTCSIGTYSTYKTKVVITDVAKALGLDYHEVQQVTKQLESLRSFETESGDEDKVDSLPFDEICKHYADLRKYFEENPEVRVHAEVIRNQVKTMSTHAAGVIISDSSLKGKIPVLYDEPSSPNRQVISAWAESGNAAELSSVGLVKYDLLGLNNLDIVDDCVRLVRENRGVEIVRQNVPIDNREAIKMGAKRDLVGIFQLENPETRSIVDSVEMESLADTSAITSLLRPGPKDMGMHETYARRKKGEPYKMPGFMRDLLAETYGVIVYQEQAMNISKELAGFTGPEANKLRKAIGKKLEDLMAEMKQKFIKGSQSRVDAGDIRASEVEYIWKQLESFAGYGFNASHAFAYSALTTVELWLKYYYPIEYVTALINNTKGGKKTSGGDAALVTYVNYARKRGIEVLPPDVNRSGSEFKIENLDAEGKVKAIRFSLRHVKNVASRAAVVEASQPYEDMADFHERAKAKTVIKTGKNAGKERAQRPNKKVVESLIAAGAFSAFGTRQEVMDEYYRLRANKKEEAPEYNSDKWLELERDFLGLVLSEPPILKSYVGVIKENKWCTIGDVDSRGRTRVFGQIVAVKNHTSKKGNTMQIATMSDGIDTLEFFIWDRGRELFRQTFRVGSIGAVPLDKFEDSNTRFFDMNADAVIIKQ